MIPPAIRYLWIHRKTVLLILTPLLLLPFPIVVTSQEASCAYVIFLMAVYWTTEVLPIAVTGMLPLVLFPILGVMPAREVSALYFKDANWLGIGGLMIAVAVESSGLHRRIALRTLLLVGVKPKRLMLGFMMASWTLSMWVSNSATTAMMIPIAEAVIKELYGSKLNNRTDGDTEVEEGKRKRGRATPRELSIMKGITICIPYAANVGGMATLTGTPANVIMAGMYEEIFPDATQKLSYGIWMSYCLPQSAMLVLITYFWLSSWFVGFGIKDMCPSCKKDHEEDDAELRAAETLRAEYEKLGSIRWYEGSVMAVFATTALMWFFREPGFMPGFSVLFRSRYVSDATVAVAMSLTLFALPRERPRIFQGGKIVKPRLAILDWPTAQRKFPWDIPIIVGGGFALAGAATQTGLSHWFSEQLAVLKGMDARLICFICTASICILTETTSNAATTTLMVPVFSGLAQTLGVHPLYLLMPATCAASLAFMLPVATPPNAIAFSYGRIKVSDLAKAGFVTNIIGIFVVTLFINSYGVALLGLSEFPAWANTSLSAVEVTAPSVIGAFNSTL